ncbi:MAG: alternate-type signal peptide domain-containing protein [Propionibacteriaceae bacterium]|jgi:alternate signal-mediated exported protein|nr:alternate-type signal peptide domain-containing protein [Propionibacteriaceae bacterium]
MTNASNKRRNAVIAAVAGAALLLGGSTYALWSATANLDGGSITAGNLNIAAGTPSAYDVSSDRTDTSAIVIDGTTLGNLTGHGITQGTWKMVPGDTMALVLPYTLTLEGDNLVAALSIDPAAIAAITATTDGDTPTNGAADLIYFSWEAFDSAGASLGYGDVSILHTAPVTVGLFQAPNDSTQASGAKDTDIPFVGGTVTPDSKTGKVYVVLTITFDATTAGQIDTEDVWALSSTIGATLTQVRCDGLFKSECSI